VQKIRVEKQIGKSILALETGFYAKQAAGSCTVQYGDTIILAAVTTGTPRPGIDFFPLTCDYRERTSAAGKFPGGFKKREGPPTTKEILTSRLIDRPIRPMFPESFKDEVQVQCIVYSSDRQNDSDILAMNGACTALGLSQMPFEGPLGSVRLARINDEWVPFPTFDELEESELDLIVSGSETSVLMIEGFSREMSEDLMLEAIDESHKYIREICQLQTELIEKVGVTKPEYVAPEGDGILERITEGHYDEFRQAMQTEGKQARADAVSALKKRVADTLIPDPKADDAIPMGAFKEAWHSLEAKIVRDLILDGTRPDGRGPDELRDISCYVDVLPRTHGSALFQRGETQALVSITLGTGRDEQRVDGLGEEYSKKFMLDYTFPPFSVGECRMIRGPGRREIGHGALAERSVKPVLPAPDDFPYTVRVSSDILESNGSSSMASVCAATLGLMAAGVPISNPVAGISVGMVEDGDRRVLLTDIIGGEDHFGDMDFKIAGTQNGITGIQLDLKLKGISSEVIRETLKQSREARIEILRNMLTAVPRPREETSEFAPRLVRTKIPPDKIGALIGPGGKNIRALQEETGTVVEVDDDGTVTIAATEAKWATEALDRIEAMTASVQIGKIYKGRVASIKDFGAFVEIVPGRDGLCHISELSNEYVSNVNDICAVGDELQVIVVDVDDHDRVKLSHRKAMEELGLEVPKPPAAEAGTGGGDGGSSGGGRGRSGGRR